jgi:1,4-dihydroxy-2-naphthoate octaprenyltransferase
MHFQLQAATVQLLRIKFSFFLMPVYWFALSQINEIDIYKAVWVFFILHFLVYPASNGYNSDMDKDVDSIGCVEKPLPPSKQLLYATVLLDALALFASVFVNFYFVTLVLLYILASKAYSYRGIRLKRFPIVSYLIAIVFQGAIVYTMVWSSCGLINNFTVAWLPAIGSTLIVGSFYPLTQIYQHKQDKADKVKTISMLLGYKGTFLMATSTIFIALVLIGYYFASNLELDRFLILLICMFPTLVYFLWWYNKVRKNVEAANFKNTMRMNLIAAICSNAAFLIILIIKEKF